MVDVNAGNDGVLGIDYQRKGVMRVREFLGSKYTCDCASVI